MEITQLRMRSGLLIASVIGGAVLTRLFLFLAPGAGGSTVLGFHVHHLLVGVLLVCIGGVPAVLLRSEEFVRSVATGVFGFGLGLALDEWVLLVLRESVPDTPYMSTLSMAGALILVAMVCGYTLLVWRFAAKRAQRASGIP